MLRVKRNQRTAKPHILQQLMRHASITTTLTFYVQTNAEEMAEAVWSAFDRKLDSSTKSLPTRETVNEESLEPRT
jgi:imidazoleglycerol phosphate dehydratase HisB